MNRCFWLGEQARKGEKLLAAFMRERPDFGRLGSRNLPRSWRALKGWRLMANPSAKSETVALCGLGRRGHRTAASTLHKDGRAQPSFCKAPPTRRCLQFCWLDFLAFSGTWVSQAGQASTTSQWLWARATSNPGAPQTSRCYRSSPPTLCFGISTTATTWQSSKKLARPDASLRTKHSNRANNWRSPLKVQKRGGWKSAKSVMRPLGRKSPWAPP